ncbi:MAG: hypothetical protein KDI31_09720 [Pseudomonadales bacterium]|nr:hypothetical protein [Pseudomonadales bacterium]
MVCLISSVATGDSVRDLRAGRGDPTRPERWSAVQPQARMELPTLSSVLLGSGRKLAVLDGRVMAEGEIRAGMKLWKVESDRVVLTLNDSAPVTVRLDRANVIKENR